MDQCYACGPWSESAAAANSWARRIHVDGCVAVGVQVERYAQVIDPLDHLFHCLFREGQFASPVFLAAGSAIQVRLGEVGGLALRGAVDRDLDAADLQTIEVLALSRRTGFDSSTLSRSVMKG